ncbi:hypothetical protein RHGRI_004993 [Rhododendron griersonianum]|uniref:Ubiquitin-like protease family profile domain-containing protein n=1 Tax=Rhododendron griersonianum TaxID=479676 RepID=A0AAV6LBW1_9ERIC|nr:hypothetical protein RHGRI_004993 [Rhododendron griersonianum]
MRLKKSPRKRTADPAVINIDDSAGKSEVVKSSSPSPRKGSKEADVEATVRTSYPTPIKINTKQHGKKPETKMVYEKRRKRTSRGDEEVIDLNTLTKRVTRSAEALKKMKMNKDMKEKEDKGIKRKTSPLVSKGVGSNRQRNVKQKVKGEEEEEEWDEDEGEEEEKWDEDEGDEEGKWDEDEGDEEENRKVKKGQKREGVKGKTGQPKQEKVEPKRGMQYRSSLNTVVKLLQTIPNGEFTTLQIQEIKKTPFADIVFGIVEAKLDEAYVRKSDPDVLKLVKQYEGSGGSFKLGADSVKITAKELTTIFGIKSGTTRIVINPTPRVPKTDFADRLCPGPKGQRILTTPILRDFFAKAVNGTTLNDAKDLARVLCLLLIGTLFVPNTQSRVSWAYLDFIEPLENSTSYNWSRFITEEVIHELNLRGSSNPAKVGGCVMGLMYWLCEHVCLIKQGDPHNIPRFLKWRLSDLSKELRTINLDSLNPLLVLSSELEPNDEEEGLYRFCPVTEHEADVKDSKVKTAVDKSNDEVVQDTSDEEADSDQNEVVTLQGIVRKLTDENAEKDRKIYELQRENEDKNATIAELRRRITNHPQTTAPGFGFEGISAQFEKDLLEHENITLQTEIGGLIIEKDIVEEKLEVAGDIIDDFVTHNVTQTYQTGEIVGEKESKGKKVDAGSEEHEIQNVEEEEEEEKEEGGGFENVQDEGGPEHEMVPDAKVDSTTVEAYRSILECGTPKRKRGKTKVKVKSSSLTRGVKKTVSRVEKRLDDYVYVDLKKGATNKSKQKWNLSEAPLIHLLRNTDANLLRQIVDCSDTDLYCTVWTNDVTRETVPLEDIMKLLQGGDVSNWMIDGLARMLTIYLDNDDKLTHHVTFFPCTIWTILLNENSDMRTVLLDKKLQRVFENVRQHGTKYYRYLVFPMNGSGGKSLKMSPYHWTILFFDVMKQKWMHYNSLKERDGRDPMLKDATVVKKYVENYMKDRHDELKNQSTSTEILFQEQNFDAPICSPPYAPQQENTSVDCGVFVCKLMELLAYIEPIPKTLPKTEIDQFRADLVSQFLNDEGRSWTIKKWEARRMGKGSQ